jgi:hypothetical protein
MASANGTNRFASPGANPMSPLEKLAERVRQYFEQPPEISREALLLESVPRELRFLQQRETGRVAGPVPGEGEGSNRWSTARRPLGAEDIRLHTWLTERLAAVHYDRHGLWPKLRRFLFSNRLVQWLGGARGGPSGNLEQPRAH